MKLNEMTKDERSLLLFFESACTEYGGKLNPRHMNEDDNIIKDKWVKSEFIKYGRMNFADTKIGNNTHWVKLSDEAWKLAHEERIARFKRLEYNKEKKQ